MFMKILQIKDLQQLKLPSIGMGKRILWINMATDELALILKKNRNKWLNARDFETILKKIHKSNHINSSSLFRGLKILRKDKRIQKKKFLIKIKSGGIRPVWHYRIGLTSGFGDSLARLPITILYQSRNRA